MAKLISAVSLIAVVIAAVVIARPQRDLVIFLNGDEANVRSLLLYAAGVRTPGPGQVRIAIPVGDVAYEVIVKRPGTPKLVAINR